MYLYKRRFSSILRYIQIVSFMGDFLKGVVMSAPLNIRKATAVDIPFLFRIESPGITKSGLHLSDEVSRILGQQNI